GVPMPPDVRDRLVFPALAGVVPAVASAALLSAAKSSVFLTVVGALAVLIVGVAIGALYVRLGRLTRQVAAVRAELGGLGQLSSELTRLREWIEVVHVVAVRS